MEKELKELFKGTEICIVRSTYLHSLSFLFVHEKDSVYNRFDKYVIHLLT